MTSSTESTPTPTPPASTIRSVTVSCAANSIPVGQTNQCTSNVQGTGNFSQTVSWSVSGVPGGNSTLGTVNSSGLYTAPETVPTPYSVNVSATSAQDGTKSSFVSVIVAGTIASTTQTVTAAAGGTITLPDGSSVTIPPNVLPIDQNVRASELSVMPQQGPNPLIVNAGPVIMITLAVPIQSNKAVRQEGAASTHRNDVGAADIIFAINETGSTGLTGALASAVVIDSNNQSVFVPATINSGSTVSSATISLSSSWLGTITTGVQSFAVSIVNTISQVIPSFVTSIQLPLSKCWDIRSTQWTDFSTCSSQVNGARVLVIVHGMMSCVESMMPSVSKAIPFIQSQGSYDVIAGFDYDWTRHLDDSAALLSAFLAQLGQLGAIQIDIIAHSEGVPVSLYAASQASDRKKINNFFGLAGPVTGTPIASDQSSLLQFFLLAQNSLSNMRSNQPCPVWWAIDVQTLLNQPFRTDLEKDSDLLMKVMLPAEKANPPADSIVLAGGINPFPLGILTGADFGNTPNDGVIGLDSALAFNSGLVVRPLPSFPLFHTDLPGDTTMNGVLSDVANQIRASELGGSSPQLTCAGSEISCDGPQAEPQTFLFTETGLSLDSSFSSSLEVRAQDSTGLVSRITPTFSSVGGGITWSMVPTCPNPGCSFFAFDKSKQLASNSLMQTLQAGAGTPAVTLNPTSLNFGNVQTGASSNQSVTLTNTGTATLQITQINLKNNAGGFSLTNPCPTSLTVGASCAVSVTFNPTQAGAQSATLSVADNASGSPQSVPLSGTGTGSSQAPTVTTSSPASAITSSSAILPGTVDPNGSDTHVWFQYSSNSSMSGAISTPQQDIGAGTTTVPFSANIAGLSANATYYYQAVASNSGGTSMGEPSNFTTTSSGPTLSTFTISPSSVTGGQSAKLSFGLSANAIGTATISLQSSNPTAFPVPSSFNIQAGQSTNSFDDQAGTVASATTATVTATYNGGSLQAQVTVNPIKPAITLLSPNPVPVGSSESILISGTNFQPGATLRFTWTVDGGGSRDRTDYDFVDSGDLIISINTGTSASTGWTVEIVNPDQQTSNIFPFSVQ